MKEKTVGAGMKITILNENTVYKRGLSAEHGLSLYIECHGRKILFDVGQSDVFLRNAGNLGVDLQDLDAVILSHGHYDHCGGMEALVKEIELPKVYITKKAFEEKKNINSDGVTYRNIGIDWDKSLLGDRVVEVEEKCEISEGIYLLQGIPYANDFEEPGKGLMVWKNEELIVDKMEDEQILVIEEDDRLHVFLGCSHPGIINALNYVKREFPGKKIDSLLAGMHLKGAANQRLERTFDELEQFDIELMMPVHCTGQEAIVRMKRRFPSQCRIVTCGEVIEI